MADNYQSRLMSTQSTAVEDRKKSDWEKTMAMYNAAAAAKASPDTMLGLTIGRLLSKYLFNGDDSLQAKPTKPEKANMTSNGSIDTFGTSTQQMRLPDGRVAVIDKLSGGSTTDIPGYGYTQPTGGTVQIGALLGDPEDLKKKNNIVAMNGGI